MTIMKAAAEMDAAAARANAARDAAMSAGVVEGVAAGSTISSAGSRPRPTGLLN